jgi:glycosyltransferase involved in cell wall biosynthesis
MQKRILFVIDGLAGGGAEKTCLALAGHFSRLGHTVAVASLKDEQVLPLPDGVHLIPAFDTKRRRLRKIREIGRRARILDAHLAEHEPWDLVVSTLAQSDRIVARSSLGDAAWYRVAIQPSAEHLRDHQGLKRARRLRRLRRTYAGRRVIAISEGVGRDLVETLGIVPSRLEAILNPFDFAHIRGLASEPCPLSEEAYLVHVGRFSLQKRHDRLLGAFAKSGFTGRLVLVGTGTERQVARVRESIAARGLESRVELTGFQLNPYPYIRHARALVLSSDYEGFGRVLVESLICGTPVVSARCPSGPDEILTGDLAVGLAELTEESLAAAIDRVLGDPPPISDSTLERFAIESIAARYLALAD